MTETGFYWPTGIAVQNGENNWLADSCDENTDYFTDEYHIGSDILGNEDDDIYAIAEGKVLHISENGWGERNIGILVEHKLDDGSSFTALYGHVRSRLQIGDIVEGGEKIATIGPWPEAHLHFGVRPGTSLNDPYGRTDCPFEGNTNGFVDPINWITTKTPGIDGPIIAAPQSTAAEISGDATAATLEPEEQNLDEARLNDPLDVYDANSVVQWISYALAYNDLLAFEKLILDSGIQFGDRSIHGTREISKQELLEMLEIRLVGPVNCIGYYTSDDSDMYLWADNWYHVWDNCCPEINFHIKNTEQGWKIAGAFVVPSSYALELYDTSQACPSISGAPNSGEDWNNLIGAWKGSVTSAPNFMTPSSSLVKAEISREANGNLVLYITFDGKYSHTSHQGALENIDDQRYFCFNMLDSGGTGAVVGSECFRALGSGEVHFLGRYMGSSDWGTLSRIND